MKSEERLLGLADMAELQWGLFTSAQAAEVDFTPQQLKRLADAGLIVRLRQGVYRLTGAPEQPEDAIRAEWLALEPARSVTDRLADEVPVGVVSHRSAALLQDLGDVDADVHEFTVARRKSTRSPAVKFHLRELTREDWHLVGGLPVTRPLRTVVDLAAARTDGGHLASIVRDAILSEDTTREELADALRPYAHQYGLRIGAGDALVHDFIGQAGIPAAAKALTRPDSGEDMVLLDAEGRRYVIQLKQRHLAAMPESLRMLYANGDVSRFLTANPESLRTFAGSETLLTEGPLRSLWLKQRQLRQCQPDESENRGGNDDSAQVSDRAGTPDRDQPADQ